MLYQKGIERREKLVDAAYTLLEERSLETISLADIAQEAKTPTGSAYHFFRMLKLYLLPLPNASAKR